MIHVRAVLRGSVGLGGMRCTADLNDCNVSAITNRGVTHNLERYIQRTIRLLICILRENISCH